MFSLLDSWHGKGIEVKGSSGLPSRASRLRLITPFLPILSLYAQAKACLTKKYGLSSSRKVGFKVVLNCFYLGVHTSISTRLKTQNHVMRLDKKKTYYRPVRKKGHRLIASTDFVYTAANNDFQVLYHVKSRKEFA